MSFYSNHTIEEQLRRIQASKKFSSAGGVARAKKLTSEKRSEIASKAAKARWENLQGYTCQERTPGQVYAC